MLRAVCVLASVLLVCACGHEPMGEMTGGGDVVGVTFEKLPTPDYTFNTGSLGITVTGQYRVDSTSGAVVVIEHSYPARQFCVVAGKPATVFEIVGAFAACRHEPMRVAIDCADVISIGTDIPATRSIIFERFDRDVSTYQMLVIPFVR